MRLVAIAALALLATGCAATPIFTSEEYAAISTLEEKVGAIDGLSEYAVNRFPISDDDVRLTVTLQISDEAHTESIVGAVTDLIDDGPFDGDIREVEVYVLDGMYQFFMTADGGEPIPTERTAIFSRLLSDPRVSDVRWEEQLAVGLSYENASDEPFIETFYGELANDVTLAGEGLKVYEPGSYTLITARHPFTEQRFAAVNEIMALELVSSCTFELESASDGTFMHHITCFALGDLDEAGTTIEDLLETRGLLSSTQIRLLSVDDEEFTHEGTFVTREG